MVRQDAGGHVSGSVQRGSGIGHTAVKIGVLGAVEARLSLAMSLLSARMRTSLNLWLAGRLFHATHD